MERRQALRTDESGDQQYEDGDEERKRSGPQ